MDTAGNIAAFRRTIEADEDFFATCDGGEPGNPESPSIWLLGIEPGWSFADEAADKDPDPQWEESHRRYSVDHQMQWPFNRNAFKLLSALAGEDPDNFREFAKRTKPFEHGVPGYLKGNLFPVPFNNIHDWGKESIESTGFQHKDEYRSWVRAARFPIIKGWIERARPSLVIGCGLTHSHDFLEITGNQHPPEVHRFEVNGHAKRVVLSRSGIVPVAIVPHLSGGPHGLNSNEAIAKAAGLIRSVLN